MEEKLKQLQILQEDFLREFNSLVRPFEDEKEKILGVQRQTEEQISKLNRSKTQFGKELMAFNEDKKALAEQEKAVDAKTVALDLRTTKLLKNEELLRVREKDVATKDKLLEARENTLVLDEAKEKELNDKIAYIEEQKRLVERDKAIDRERKLSMERKEKELSIRETRLANALSQ